MPFFDSQQDVLDIQLTSYGKFLLSKGEFKPEFYAFFDEDIIYDNSYCKISEDQNAAQTRILENTLFSKETISKVSKEKSVNFLNKHFFDYSEAKETYANIENNIRSLPLGTSEISNKHIPAWDIKSLNGKFDSIKVTGSASDLSNFPRIPQIYLKDTLYDVKINKDEASQNIISLETISLPDGTKIETIEDYILLEIDEKNIEDLSKNFEIEIYPMDNDSSWEIKNGYKNLNFAVKPENIIDDMIMSPDEMPKAIEVPNLDPSFVQHFFDVLVDDEIDLYISQISAQGKASSIAERLSNTYRPTVIGPTDPIDKEC